jgi:hypothetical protein
MTDLVGKKYTFEDGNTIEIIQVKMREEGETVTYLIGGPSDLPRKLVMQLPTFLQNFGHLFGLREPPDRPY